MLLVQSAEENIAKFARPVLSLFLVLVHANLAIPAILLQVMALLFVIVVCLALRALQRMVLLDVLNVDLVFIT